MDRNAQQTTSWQPVATMHHAWLPRVPARAGAPAQAASAAPTPTAEAAPSGNGTRKNQSGAAEQVPASTDARQSGRSTARRTVDPYRIRHRGVFVLEEKDLGLDVGVDHAAGVSIVRHVG